MKHPVFVNVIYILYNTLIVLFYHPPFQITMYQSQEIIITRGFCIVQVITHVDCDVEHRGYANCHWRTSFFVLEMKICSFIHEYSKICVEIREMYILQKNGRFGLSMISRRL